MFCDGDSKAYDSIVASKIYGEDIYIEKESTKITFQRGWGQRFINLLQHQKLKVNQYEEKGN